MLKPTPSQDGVRRATVRVEYRIELGACLLAAVELAEDGQELNRKAIEARVRDRLQDGGYNWMHWGNEQTRTWEQGDYDDFADKLLPEVRKLFPEFDHDDQ